MKNLYLVLIVFLFSANIFAGDFFYYNEGKKNVLPKDDTSLVVKFKDGISSSSSLARVQALLGSSAKKKTYFAPGSSSSVYVVVELNRGSDAVKINRDLLASEDIVSVGYCFPGRGKVKHYTTNEILVKFNRGVSGDAINTSNKFYKTTVIEKVSDIENLYLLSVESRGDDGLDNVFEVTRKYQLLSSMVEYAQPNFIREGLLLSEDMQLRPLPVVMPNDSLLADMWHVKNTGTNIPHNVIGTVGCDMNLDSAWAITTGNPNVLIAIVDTGVDTNHTDLIANFCDRNLWYDAVDNNQRPYDQYYHGTGVAGTCSAVGNNHIGTAGVAYTCKMMPVRVFGPASQGGYTTDLILGKGLNWAWTHGASVINCSWGGGISTPLITNTIRDAVKYGRSGRGALIFAGSGNSEMDTILYPANMPEVIGVGGMSPCYERKNPHSCDFIPPDSNQYWGASYGNGLSLVAPCTFIGTTQLLGDWCICGNGTSCSSPLAAGVGALVFSKNSMLSGDSARMIIERSARKVGNYNYNVPKVNGLWNYEMGYGLIDSKRALDMTPAGPSTTGDMVPPQITIYPPESGVYTSNVSFTAGITDNNGVSTGYNIPKLYYYTMQNYTMQVLNSSLVSAGTYKFTFPKLPYSMGAYYYIAAQDDNSNVTTYPIGGKGSNPPGSVKPQRMMYFRNTKTYDTSYTATDVPKVISPARETTVVSVYHNSISKIVLDVDCWFSINHTYDADMTMSLISPAGTEIILTGGTGGGGHNYVDTYFDDEATNPIDDTANHAPFTGHFRPVQRLWFFDGENSGGDWKLKIVDNGPSDGGELVSWGMKFRYSAIDDNVIYPDKFSLVGNYPNPFNPRTRILFNLPYAADVKIVLYDINGREVKKLLNERRGPALEDFIDFDYNSVENVNGSGLASGVYFYSLIADGKFIESKKMVLLK